MSLLDNEIIIECNDIFKKLFCHTESICILRIIKISECITKLKQDIMNTC